MSDELLPVPDPEEEQSEETFSKQLPIEWYVPDSVLSGYATNMTLQRTDHEFILSFYEQRVPVFTGPPEEIQARLMQIESVRATCFARVIIAPARFPDFMNVLQRALSDFQPEQKQED